MYKNLGPHLKALQTLATLLPFGEYIKMTFCCFVIATTLLTTLDSQTWHTRNMSGSFLVFLGFKYSLFILWLCFRGKYFTGTKIVLVRTSYSVFFQNKINLWYFLSLPILFNTFSGKKHKYFKMPKASNPNSTWKRRKERQLSPRWKICPKKCL